MDGSVVEAVARELSRATVEINPGRSEVSAIVGWRMVAGAAEALEALWRIVG